MTRLEIEKSSPLVDFAGQRISLKVALQHLKHKKRKFTKEEIAAYRHESYLRNREKATNYQRDYYLRNKERVTAHHKEYKERTK